jgi:hypothetical protein
MRNKRKNIRKKEGLKTLNVFPYTLEINVSSPTFPERSLKRENMFEK